MPAFRRYVISIKVVAGLTTTARCRPIKPTKIKVHFEGGWTWLNNKERSSRHMRTSAVPNNVTHTPTSSPFFLYPAFSLFFSGLRWVRADFHVLLTALCYFCTEIRRRLPFRSQSHISVEFFLA